MSYTSEELQKFAIAIVAKGQPCKPNDLLDQLKREYGTSHGEGAKTMFILIGDRRLKRTFSGKLVLPDHPGFKF